MMACRMAYRMAYWMAYGQAQYRTLYSCMFWVSLQRQLWNNPVASDATLGEPLEESVAENL